MDGWSEMSTSTHYIGVYAVYANDGKRISVMLAFPPLIDQTTMTADSHIDLILFALSVHKKSINNIQFMVADNENLNKAVLIEVSITGTAGYVDMKFVPPTSNTLERFFSKAKFFLGDYRYRITPEHFEAQLFLNVTRTGGIKAPFKML